jgi:ABC-type molybdenum transport system ATPase subunit/photorepair protein PhrA
MPFTLNVPGLAEAIQLEVGESLFVLGANGTGKSALLQRFMANAGLGNAKTKRVVGTRTFNRAGWSKILKYGPA